MKTNLSSQITLTRIPLRYYRPENAFEHSVLTRLEKIPTNIYESAEEGSFAIAKEIATQIRKKQDIGKPFVIALPGGRSPLSVYKELIRMHKEENLSFRNVIAFVEYEFYPLANPSAGNLARLKEELFDQVDIDPANIYCPDGSMPKDAILDFCRQYEETIQSVGGIDCMLLGIGNSSNIMFNVGGTTISSRTRMVLLEGASRKEAARTFENLKAQSMKSQNVPYRRESFREKHTIIEFDSDFNMVDGDIMGRQSSAKDMAQLQSSIDSMKVLGDSIGRQYYKEVAEGNFRASYGLTKEDTAKIEKADIQEYNVDSLYEVSPLMQKQKVISSAVSRAENMASDLTFKSYTMETNDYAIRKHKTEWHKKITISLSCLLFFFIGAPLGGIIRKGGLGMPVIVSVLVFIIYYIIDNTGYKMARDGKWIVWMGMWTSSAVLAPLGIFLTYKSNKDSVVLNADAYINWFKKVLGIRSVRHLFKKEVIINDPDYERIPSDLESLTAECRAYITKNRLTKAPNYFKLWMSTEKDDEVMAINEKLEVLVEEMSNTKSATLIGALNNYPVIPVSAHIRPFHIYWLNLVAGIIFPVGLFFYFRIWAFRIRLDKDMERIIKNNEQVQFIIQKINK